ncbi:hypothetical protein IJ076_03250, partial [Candidatus Saccharibacteria bacterium]|nr:hypothetical protein [Candidatus Saccharibacteria bacterium]
KEKETEKETETEPNKEGYSTEKEKIEQYTGESPNKADELTGLVTYAGVSGEKLIVRLNIDQFLSTGSCSLTISKDDNVYFSQSSAIIESVTTSTCDGFEIPVSNFPSGNLRIVVLLESGGKSGKIEGEVRL